MVRISEALVPIYRELWQQDLDLDTYRAASYIHDAAKVIEFSEKDGGVVGIPGYNHAIEAGRIVRELGGPSRSRTSWRRTRSPARSSFHARATRSSSF